MSMSVTEARFQPGSKWLLGDKEVTVVKLSHAGEFVHVNAGAPWPTAVRPGELEPIIKPGDKVRVLPGAMYSTWGGTPKAVQRTGGEAEARNSPDFEGDVLVQGVGYVNVAYLEKVEEGPVKPEPEFKVGDRVRVAEDAKTPLGVSSSAAGTTSVITELEEGGALLENCGFPALRYLTLIEDEEPADEPTESKERWLHLPPAVRKNFDEVLDFHEVLALARNGFITRDELREYLGFPSN